MTGKAALFLLSWPLAAQLITNPAAVPRTPNAPVVFLNGFETDCASVTFQHEFGIADQLLQAIGRPSLFFNNCAVSGSPSIEKLGAAFGAYLASLTYTDGTPVPSVDAIGYSMGGLILRSYLSGKQEALATFTPPLSTGIGKAIFIATPNFGSPVGALAFGFSTQADELSSGSHFLMDLNTWNQNRDDLRGVDAIAIAGTGGTGVATTPGFDDGLVALSSASLLFYMPGRTRVLPLCHVAAPGLLTETGFCPPGAKGIAQMLSAGDDNSRIVSSFFSGTSEWQNVGQAIEQNPFLTGGGGILVRARTAADVAIDPSSVKAAPAAGAAKTLNMSNGEIAYTDLIGSGPANLTVNAGAQSFSQSVNVPAGGAQAFVIKPGPMVNAVIPAAAPVFPLVVAPRMIVAIYGSALDAAAVTLDSIPAAILYASPGQINAVLPAGTAPGLRKLTVSGQAGAQTINVWVEPEFPAVFSLDQSGTGAAAAVNALLGGVVSKSNPLHAGDFLELFLTGLGATQNRNGFDYAIAQPTVMVGGADCPVTFAGAAPGFMGLDQINCRIPAGLGAQAAAPVVVRSGGRTSGNTTVALQ